ncbi:Chondroitin Sulfate Proteoglycan 4 [Manis pentadactyla]|nr:Chondroitin Sulfate Proteoglycan 4 [Manis pentadactyla]
MFQIPRTMLSTAPLGTEVTVPAQRIGGPRGDFLAGREHLDSTDPTNQQRGGSTAHWTHGDSSRDSRGPELSSPGEEGPIGTTL